MCPVIGHCRARATGGTPDPPPQTIAAMTDTSNRTLEQEQEIIRKMHAMLRWIYQLDKRENILNWAPSCRHGLRALLDEIES